MKLHLPKLLLTAVLTAIGATASHADDSSTSYTLGDVMYVGDSITHGYYEASYRWALHKILVDNGVKYNEVGYATNNTGGDYAKDSYRGVNFDNKHSAQSGIRAWDVAGKTSKTATEYTNDPIKGILNTTSASTFVLLLGTNDLLSDNNSLTNVELETVTNNLLGTDRKSGDIGHIVDAMYASNPTATLYVSTIPVWTYHNNNDAEESHAAVATYNESLKTWVANYNTANSKNIKLVDVNRGMLDVAAEKPFYGVEGMFKNPPTDGLHPNAQGELIIAGNMARAMGIAGRTAGAERKAAAGFSYKISNDGSNLKLTPEASTLSFSWSESDSALVPAGDFTAELMGFTFGNGEYNTWDTTDNFTFTIGNGSNLQGSLSINEAYIQWGSDILFSENMSTLTENIRMAYITGDSANGINSGFYVWLGDMLIGEALGGTETTAALNGVSISYSGTSSYTLQGVAMDSTGAYAPTYGLFNNPAENGCVVVPNNVNWATPTTGTYIYATNTTDHKGDVWVKVDAGQATGWAAAQGNSGSTDGNITMIFEGEFKGCYDDNKADNKAGTVFGAVNSAGGVNGNVTIQLDAPNAKYNSFGEDNESSIVGAYGSTITGTFKAVINAGTFTYDILGGIHTGSSHYIGATEIYINGGTLNANVYGGGRQGSIDGDTYVAVSGGSIAGNIYAGGKGDTIKGNTCLTITGNTAAIKGDTISGGGTSGSIVGSSTVIIKNVSSENAVADSIATFDGTLTGGSNVAGLSSLIFENAHITGKPVVEHFDSIALSSSSNINLGQTSLTGSSSSISIADNSSLTIHGNFTTEGNLTVQGGNGSLILAGSSNSFGGAINISAGNSLSLGGNVEFNNIDVSGLTYSYDPEYIKTIQTNGLGNAIVSGLTIKDLISGEGSLIIQDATTATVNGLQIGSLSNLNENESFVVENAIYYVMYSPTTNDKTQLPAYSLGNGSIIPMDNVVTVGNHNYSGPKATEGTNEASGFYIDQHGVLCIVGNTDKLTAEQIITTAQGNGDIIVRSPGYQAEHAATSYTYELALHGKTNVTGNLYLSPIVVGVDKSAIQQIGANLILDKGADISSFNSVSLCHGETSLIINGNINSSRENAGHINNLAMKGSSRTMLYVNENANEHIILGGDTCIRSYQHDSNGRTFSNFNIEMNRNGKITIEHLTSEDDVLTSNYQRWNTILNFLSSKGDKYDTNQDINATLDILSFDFRGSLAIYAYKEGALHINVTLANKNQELYDYQYFRGSDASTYNGDQTLTIKGSGTYILSEGNSIKDNFGILSTEYAEDGVTRIWTGTVEVNNLAATDGWNADSTKNGFDFSLYGNEQSTVHFKGFKGHLFNTTTNNAYLNITVAQDLILENSSTMNAYEISDGYSGQVQTYTGAISGTGDFVVSAGSSMTFNLQGDLSEWKDGAELKVTGGTQAVNFSGEATKVNADIAVADTAKLNMSVGTDTDTDHTTTFNGKVKASSLTTYSGTTAEFAGTETKIGNVNISSRDKENAAVIKSGMTITNGNTVSGGEASNAVLAFDSTEGSLSNAKLTGVSLCALQASASIKMQGIVANDVYLAGATNFESLDEQTKFVYQGIVEAFDKNYNEVYFESESFSGMTLDGDLTGTITLSVSNDITVSEGAAMADVPTNVSILLKGFTVEGLTLGKRMEGMFKPLDINIMDGTQVAALSADTVITVGQLLNYEDYQEIYYVQQADGLLIRMSNIPEPTTATLSLLALTALATRRRRK